MVQIQRIHVLLICGPCCVYQSSVKVSIGEMSEEQDGSGDQDDGNGDSNSIATFFVVLFLSSALLCFVANGCVLVLVVKTSRALSCTALNCYLTVQASVNLLTIYFNIAVSITLLTGRTPGAVGCAVSVLLMDIVIVVSLFLHIFVSHSLLQSMYDPLYLRYKRTRLVYLLVLIISAAVAGLLHCILLFSKEEESELDLTMCYWVGQGLDNTNNATFFLIITILVVLAAASSLAVSYYKYYKAIVVKTSKSCPLESKEPLVLEYPTVKKGCSIICNSETETITSYAVLLTGFLVSLFPYLLASISAYSYAIAGVKQHFSPAAYLSVSFLLCLFTLLPFVLVFINTKLKRRFVQTFYGNICERIHFATDGRETSNGDTFDVQGSEVQTVVPEYPMGMSLGSYTKLLRDLFVDDGIVPASQKSSASGHVQNPFAVQEAWV